MRGHDRTKAWSIVAAAAVIAALALGAPARAQAPGAGGPPPPPKVTVVALKTEDVTLTSTLPGRVVASATAEVRPQVDGIIVERMFKEGADVALGDPLYKIDDASYKARVAAAQAQVAQAKAQLKVAENEAARIQALIDRNVASKQSLDEAIATRDGAAAALQVAEAELRTAEIGLERATIRAPLSGVIGRSLTTQGSLVTDGQSEPLAVIRAIDPVLVDVTQSAAELIAWKRGVTRERLAGAAPSVRLILADGSQYEQEGVLTAAEPYVNEQTGVVTLRMAFDNPDRLLLPGMYVQVVTPQTLAKNVVLAPQEGVTRDRRGRPIALVLGEGDVVEQRPLTVLQALGPHWVVSEGLKDGDRMIVSGLQRARPGAKATPELRDDAASTPTQ